MARRRLADIVSCKLRYAVLCTHLSFSGCLLMAYIGSLKPPSPQQKTLYATQHKGFYCINSSRYINAPIICTSKILNTVIDGNIMA